MSDADHAKKSEDSSAATSSEVSNEDRTVCFCHCVSAQKIKEAIQAGANTLELIQGETGASTGCGGCEFEVREILEDQKKVPTD